MSEEQDPRRTNWPDWFGRCHGPDRAAGQRWSNWFDWFDRCNWSDWTDGSAGGSLNRCGANWSYRTHRSSGTTGGGIVSSRTHRANGPHRFDRTHWSNRSGIYRRGAHGSDRACWTHGSYGGRLNRRWPDRSHRANGSDWRDRQHWSDGRNGCSRSDGAHWSCGSTGNCWSGAFWNRNGLHAQRSG